MPSVIRGPKAVIQWSYHCAATLGSWELTESDTGGTLTAQVIEADHYRLTQPALTFCITRQNRPPFVWPVLSLHVADGTLNAALGPQE